MVSPRNVITNSRKKEKITKTKKKKKSQRAFRFREYITFYVFICLLHTVITYIELCREHIHTQTNNHMNV